jgi:hypothetical protein
MVLENSDKATDMRTASLDDAADLLREIAGERRPDESLKGVFRRLNRKLSGWSDNRIRDIWRRDSRVRVRAEEVEQLRAIAKRDVPQGITENELAELRATVDRFASYIPLLERIDAEFHGPQIFAARDQLGEARRLLGKSSV